MKKADKVLKLVVLAALLLVVFGPMVCPIAILDDVTKVKEAA